jgi:hypothetical protein
MIRFAGRVVGALTLSCIVGLALPSDATAQTSNEPCFETGNKVKEENKLAVARLQKQLKSGQIDKKTYDRLYRERNALMNQYYNSLRKVKAPSGCNPIFQEYLSKVALLG